MTVNEVTLTMKQICTILAMSHNLDVAISTAIYSAIALGVLRFFVHYWKQVAAMALAVFAFVKRSLGANWRTSLTAFLAEVFYVLTWLSGLSYAMGPMADFIPPNWKATIFTVSLFSKAALSTLNGLLQKDRSVTGGVTAQDEQGNVAAVQPATPAAPAPALPKL